MDRIVLVTKKTRLQNMVLEHNREDVVKFVLETNGQSIHRYKAEDIVYEESLASIRNQISNDIQLVTVERDNLPSFIFRNTDLIIVCGPDGLFANVAKFVENQEILTINPDPSTVAGVLMIFKPTDISKMIGLIKKNEHRIERLPFIKAVIDKRDTIWGINDIFAGRKDQISSRYKISFNGTEEHQYSSGVIVSTGIGSTGWIKSIQSMLKGIVGSAGKLNYLPNPTQEELVFVVREPFPSPDTGTNMVTGRISKGCPLSMVSEMPDGYIFSDGVIEDAVKWNAGSTVEISVGDRYINRIVL